MDKRIKYYLIVDVETANSLDDPLVYDIGGVVTDKQGRIYETFSYIVRDIFVGEKNLMNTAYYAEKVPDYWRDIWSNKREVINFMDMWQCVLKLMARYNITDVCAYNTHFDRLALDMTLRYLTKSKYRFFFPYNTNFICIWNMATQTICKQKSYVTFCEENNFLSNRGRNYSTSAETVFRYLNREPDFKEEHKGLDDVIIETEIFVMCWRQHKSFPYGRGIRRNCWRDIKRVV